MPASRKTPRPHQIAGLEQLREGMRQGRKRLLLVMLMGAGKTITALEMVRCAIEERGKRCLFLVDRRMLADQAAAEARDYGLYTGVLMADRGIDPDAPLQVASKQTLISRCLNSGRFTLPPADLLVIDEAHRATAADWGRIREAYPDAYIVGLTATPCLGDGSGLGDYYDWLVQPIKPSELLAQGLIVPARCYSPHVPDLKGVATSSDGDWSCRKLERLLNKANLVGDVVQWWQRYGEGRTSVYFATGVQHALAIRQEFLQAGVAAECIDESTPDDLRAEWMARLKSGDLSVIVNVDVMAEGIDCPEVQLVGLVRPTKRRRRYLQMVGRGLRPCPEAGKKDCVVIDHGGCVLYHGFPDADVEWTLDTATKIDDVVKAKRAAGELAEPILCPKCSYLFTKTNVCPACGHKLKRQPKGIGSRAGTLVEVARDGQPVEASPEQLHKARTQHWRMCIAVAAKRGGPVSMALAMFKSRWQVWPGDAGMDPLPAREDNHRPAVEVFPGFARRKEAQTADGG